MTSLYQSPRQAFTARSINSISSIESSQSLDSPCIRTWQTKNKAVKPSVPPTHPRRLYERSISFGTDQTDSSPFVASSSDEDVSPQQQDENCFSSHVLSLENVQRHSVAKKQLVMMKSSPLSMKAAAATRSAVPVGRPSVRSHEINQEVHLNTNAKHEKLQEIRTQRKAAVTIQSTWRGCQVLTKRAAAGAGAAAAGAAAAAAGSRQQAASSRQQQ